MEAKSLKDKTVNGVFWNAINRFSTQGIHFIFNILIARILLPEDYGVVAMLSIFLAVSQAFIDSGFANALVRKINRTEADYNTVFYFNIVISFFFCAVLWLCAPAIANFYDTPILVKITRIVCFNLVINAFGAIQRIKMTIDINFRTKAVISVIVVSAVGAVGLWMAKKGYGVWALVVQSLVSSSLGTILAWLFVKWKPKLLFSWQSLREMFSFGSKLLVSGLLDTLWGNIYNIVIGKVNNPSALGYYNRAESFATFPSSNIYGMVQGVSYPILCSIQDDHIRLRESFRKFIKLFAYIVFPMMIGLSVVADPFIRVILTDKWSDSIPLLRILCFSLMWYPINGMNMTFPNVLGRSDLYLKMVIITKIMDVIVLIATIPMGLVAMCLGRVFTSVVGFGICSQNVRKLLGYSTMMQVKDFFNTFLHSIIMGVLVLVIMFFIHSILLKLVVGILVGASYYLAISGIFQKEEFYFLMDIVKQKIKR